MVTVTVTDDFSKRSELSGTLRPHSSSSKDSLLYWRITLEHKRCCKASVCIKRISVARTDASAL